MSEYVTNCEVYFEQGFEKNGPEWPKVGVVGIAGEVKENMVNTTNIKHWPRTEGQAIAQVFGMDDF